MRAGLVRAAVFALLAPLVLCGAFGHVDRLGLLSQGTQLFAPDHPEHAPFVADKEHPCAACAVANLTPPAVATLLPVPPAVGTAHETRSSWRAPAPALPELPGRSPPSLT